MNKVLITAASVLVCCLVLATGKAQFHSNDMVVRPESRIKARDLSIVAQRSLLFISATHYAVLKELGADLDSSLIYAAGSLGISRLAAVSEGFEDTAWVRTNRWFDERDPGRAIQLLPRLRGVEHLRLMVLLGAYYSFQPSAWLKYKDSVLYYLSRAQEESRGLHEGKWDRQIFCLLGKTFVGGGEMAKGDRSFDECLKQCLRDKDQANEAKAWMYRGLYTPLSATNSAERISFLKKAAALYDTLHQPVEASNCWIDAGYLYFSTLDIRSGEDAFKEGLRLQDSAGFPYTHYAADNIAMAGSFLNKYGEPLKYSLRSVKTSEELEDSVDRGIFYARLGQLYQNQDNRATESIRWMEKSIDFLVRHESDPEIYQALDILLNSPVYKTRPAGAMALAKKYAALHPPQAPVNRLNYHLLLGDCYLEMKQAGAAEVHLMQAGEIQKELERVRGTYNRAFLYSGLGKLYLLKGQYNRARNYLELALSTPYNQASTLRNTLNLLSLLFQADSVMGRSDRAFRDLQNYNKVLDSSLNVQLDRQAEELAVQYETEQKEAQIKMKDEHIAVLQEADMLRQNSLHHAELVRNMTIVGIVISLAIAGLLFRLFMQKQSAARIIDQKNGQLEDLLSEKDWLLKEVHHRVKNNLHTVICLLESQAQFLDSGALEVLDNSRRRIYAMSLLHQKIYQTEEMRAIDMELYVPEFVRYLKESFGSPSHFHLIMEIEPIQLSIAQAIPVVLILNEAVTNAMKHAFPGRNHGEIIIRLYRRDNTITLSVADNGVGMNPAIVDMELNSLGLSLMQGLSRELRGEIIFGKNNGTVVNVIFEAGPPGGNAYVPGVWQSKESSI